MITTPTPAMIAQASADHPTLTPVTPGHYANAELAVINVRQDLKDQFPDVSFRVRLQVNRGGRSTLTVGWIEWPIGTTPASVTIETFLRNRWARFEDLQLPLTERVRRERFRNVFGGVERLRLEPVPPTPEQWARHERKMLKATMNEETGRAMLDPAPRSPRSRL